MALNKINIMRNYYRWMINHHYQLVKTSYLDRHNDYIHIYLKKIESGFFLTDRGSTLSSLLDEGWRLDTPIRKKLLKMVLNKYGILEKNGKLQINATENDLSLKKHFLIQSILSINDMFSLL